MDVTALFHGPNAGYALDLYDAYLRDPEAVDPHMRALFDLLPPTQEAPPTQDTPPASSAPIPADTRVTAPTSTGASALSVDLTAISNASRLGRNIRNRGHLAARLDPLGSAPQGNPGLLAETYGLETALAALPAEVIGGPSAVGAANAREAIDRLRAVYEETTGYDYSHVHDPEERAWLREAAEAGRYHVPLSPDEKQALLERLTEVEAFESFLQQGFQGQKRFSIEGTDALVPMLDEIIHDAAEAGAREVVMGMAHRGRLNVLAHVLDKPYERIFTEFREAAIGEGPAPTEGINRGWQGDVKYHLGARKSLRDGEDRRISITLASNPSHLEFVDPVIEGMTRAAQERRATPGAPTQDDAAALPILIHGDAAFPGEGVVAETLNLSRLRGYRTGGAIHIITNNQIGFTTEPSEARSTLYASDLAKGFEIPIIHVNGDDIAACLGSARLAHAYRARFHKDILIDLVGYRRYGHNEGDEPAFTQPLLYDVIRAHPTLRTLWARQLDREGVVPLAASDALLAEAVARLRDLNRATASAAPPDEAAEAVVVDNDAAHHLRTGVAAEKLTSLNEALLRWPDGFAPHRRLTGQLERRRAALGPDGTIDWGLAETLALASILADGTPIRLTGQDSERGTFSQRHLVLHDATTGATFTPLQTLPEARAAFAVYNSPLSEAGAIGFEYGYNVHAPETLVLWEAQYGDFANAGQVVIDQFIAAARAKWRQYPSLALLLPHGYEGQGPEHSNARIERYLQLSAHDNMWVTNPTTAAQYFHLLRRQAALLRSDPRPLIMMAPKSLLRNKRAAARLEDLTQGSFQPVLDDPDAATRRDGVSRLVLCSGKVYVDLVDSPLRAEGVGVAIARVEELYPFPAERIEEVFAAYPGLRDVIWLQEEPANFGAWGFIAPQLRELTERHSLSLRYIGRNERASPAVGSARIHLAEQAKIVADAFSGVRELVKSR